MKAQHGFYWYDRDTGEGLRITTVVMLRPSCDVSLIPDRGRGIVVSPSQLSQEEFDQLLAGISLLADRAREKASNLDKTAARLLARRQP